MRFRRPTLVGIMLMCLLIISWIHLANHEADDIPLPPLAQAPWPESLWQTWQSHEGVTVHWQSRAHATGTLYWLHPKHAAPSFIATLDSNASVSSLLDQIAPRTVDIADAAQPAILLIHGPWSATDMHTLAAIVIHQWRLQPWPASTARPHPALAHCISTHPSAAFWWAEQQALTWYQQSQLNIDAVLTQHALPNRTEWQAWRSQQSRKWYQLALSDDGQIDIQANLAYHQLPYRLLAQWYDDLARSQALQVFDFQQCLAALVDLPRD